MKNLIGLLLMNSINNNKVLKMPNEQIKIIEKPSSMDQQTLDITQQEIKNLFNTSLTQLILSLFNENMNCYYADRIKEYYPYTYSSLCSILNNPRNIWIFGNPKEQDSNHFINNFLRYFFNINELKQYSKMYVYLILENKYILIALYE